jgi:hypothetical protein
MEAAVFALICLGTIGLGLTLALRAPKHAPGWTYTLIAAAIVIALLALVTVLGITFEWPALLLQMTDVQS